MPVACIPIVWKPSIHRQQAYVYIQDIYDSCWNAEKKTNYISDYSTGTCQSLS